MMLSLIAAALAFTACGEEKKQLDEDASLPMQNEMHMENEEVEEEEIVQTLEFTEPAIANAYQHYIHVKTALVNSDAQEAQAGAKMLVGALENVEGMQGALDPAQEIAAVADINVQRTAFADLTGPFEEILTGSIASGEVYKQYCPMAFEGEGGYWISSDKEVRNPFYGDKMLKCGSVKAVIQ